MQISKKIVNGPKISLIIRFWWESELLFASKNRVANLAFLKPDLKILAFFEHLWLFWK